MKSHAKMIKLKNGCSIEMLLSGDSWLGLGKIAVGKAQLRDGSRPIVLRIDTPDGILYTGYKLKKIVSGKSGKATVLLAAFGYPWGRQEYLDEYEQSQYAVMNQPEMVEDEVRLDFTPAVEQLCGREWLGFDYQVSFSSRKRSIHRIVVDATWEIGGTIVGNTVLSQGQCNMPAYRGAKASVFTTAVLKALHMYGSPLGMSFQLAPRGGLLQGFDFQYCKDGALLHYWPKMDSVSSLIESPKNSTRLHVVDEYRFELGKKVATAVQRVLFTCGKLAEHEGRDLWWEAIEKVYGSQRKQYGVVEPLALPEGHKIGYPTAKGNTVTVNIHGHEVEHQDWLYAIAEHHFPKLAKNGIKRFWMETINQSDATEMGMMRKLEMGAHGDLHCGSICCTWRFFPSDFWGGIKAWKHLYNAGRKLGIEVGTWAAPHLSHNSPIFREHPDWKITGVNSLANGGGYGIHAINALDWNTGICDWILSDFRRWKEEGGLDYVWLDSWSNLGLLPVNYAKGMRSNWHPLSRFCGEMSKLGVGLSFESLSPYGLMSCGFCDLRGYQMGQNHAVAGQNDFGWWVGEEDMMFNVNMHDIHPRERSEAEVYGIKFKAMANRGFIMLPGLLTTGKDMPENHIQLHLAYGQVCKHMKARRLLPGGLGTCWSDGKTEVVWAYKAGALPLESEARVERLIGDSREAVPHDGLIKLDAQQVYLIAHAK